MNNRDILFEYQESRFWLCEEKNWYSNKIVEYTITGIAEAGKRLCLPDSYQGVPVSCWNMTKEKKQLPIVKTICLPNAVTHVYISNEVFPNLQKVELQAGHTAFSTDGKMLFSADGKELLYSLAAGNCDKAVVPGTVKKIAVTAFQKTVCSEIVFENPDVSVEDDAFSGSEWLKKQGEYCIVGNMFYKLNHSMDKLIVPQGVRRFHEQAFISGAAKHLVTPVMPSRRNIEDMGRRIYRSVLCEEITVSSVHAAVNLQMLHNMERLRAVHIAEGHKKYCSVDGVVFSSDKKCLEYYPQARDQKEYSIPDGTEKIGREAFAGQKYLEKIRMPSSVQRIGMGAFYKCEKLREVVFSDSIREIPDASAYQNRGVFEKCGELEEAVMPSKLRYVGRY